MLPQYLVLERPKIVLRMEDLLGRSATFSSQTTSTDLIPGNLGSGFTPGGSLLFPCEKMRYCINAKKTNSPMITLGFVRKKSEGEGISTFPAAAEAL